MRGELGHAGFRNRTRKDLAGPHRGSWPSAIAWKHPPDVAPLPPWSNKTCPWYEVPYGWLIGYYVLAGVPEATQRALVSPGIATNWVSPLTATAPSNLPIASDINLDMSRAFYATATIVAHSRTGHRTAATGTGANIRPVDLGAQGGNVGYLDGSIRWKNLRAMEPHVASDVTSVVIGYW